MNSMLTTLPFSTMLTGGTVIPPWRGGAGTSPAPRCRTGMAIRKPGRVLLRGLPFSFMRSRIGGAGRRSVDTQIALVPLVDFLITLVVFLLVSFSSSGDLQADDFRLPEAVNVTALEYAPVIVVNT